MTSYSTTAQKPSNIPENLPVLARQLQDTPSDFSDKLKHFFENASDQLQVMRVLKSIELLRFTTKRNKFLLTNLNDNQILKHTLPNYERITNFIRNRLIILLNNLPSFKQHIEFNEITGRKKFKCAIIFDDYTIILPYEDFFNSYSSLKDSPLYKKLKFLEIIASKQINTSYCNREISKLVDSIKFFKAKLKKLVEKKVTKEKKDYVKLKTQKNQQNQQILLKIGKKNSKKEEKDNTEDSKILIYDLIEEQYKKNIEELTNTCTLLKRPIYLHDFAELLFECILPIFNACKTTKIKFWRQPRDNFRLSQELKSFHYPRPGDPSDTSYEESKPKRRKWSCDDADFLEDQRSENDKIKNWPSSDINDSKAETSNNKKELSTQEIITNNLQVLEKIYEKERDSLSSECILLAIKFYKIISDETMNILQKVKVLTILYRTPEELLNHQKTLVGYTKIKDRYGRIKFVHHLPQDLMDEERNGALLSNRSRKAAIKRASYSQAMQIEFQKARRGLEDDFYYDDDDLYFSETINHQMRIRGEKRLLREKIIFKAFEFLFSRSLLDLNEVESIFSFNNCEFLKYAENFMFESPHHPSKAIDSKGWMMGGANHDIEKYELGKRLIEYFE